MTTLTRRPCQDCGRPCRTLSGVCGPCQGLGEDGHALTGGRWVNVRGIQRWQPDPVAEEPVDPPPAEPKPEKERPKPPCGTEPSYQWHRTQWRRRGLGTWPLPADDPCGCRAAHAAHRAFRAMMARAESEAA